MILAESIIWSLIGIKAVLDGFYNWSSLKVSFETNEILMCGVHEDKELELITTLRIKKRPSVLDIWVSLVSYLLRPICHELIKSLLGWDHGVLKARLLLGDYNWFNIFFGAWLIIGVIILFFHKRRLRRWKFDAMHSYGLPNLFFFLKCEALSQIHQSTLILIVYWGDSALFIFLRLRPCLL